MLRTFRSPAVLRGEMLRTFRSAAVAMLAVLGLLLTATAAIGATRVLYSGKTSQHQPISFAIAAHEVTNLTFKVEVRCPHQGLRRYSLSHFSKIAITASRFDQKFKSAQPSTTAVVKGKIKTNRITGSVSFSVPATHCSGTATYVVTRQRPRPAHPAS